MSWLDAAIPVRMRRVAVVAPAGALRDVLVRLAAAGTVEIGPASGPEDAAAGAVPPAAQDAALTPARPDLAALARAGRHDLLAGEAQLEAYASTAVRRSGMVALAGWTPAASLEPVTASLAEVGGTLVVLPPPPGVRPPTQVAGRPLRRSVSPLVQAYGTVPYADIAPVWLAWASYVLMFGMMFGDAGEGAALVGAAVALRAGWPRWARRFRQAWLFVGGAGLTATVFGFLYGEVFGGSGLVPAVWLDPLDRPATLLAVAAGVGAALLAGAYALGTVNRWREGGWPCMLYAPSGVAGTGLFVGAAAMAAGWWFHSGAGLIAGGAVALAGLALAAAGFLAEAGGGTGVMQAVIELLDMIVRLGSNVASFTRLAAFGLTHAALGLVVWQGARALWRLGPGSGSGASVAGVACAAGAVVVLAAGTALAFSLEALVAAVQALRLEYYELFSRVFVDQGRPFRPWHVPTAGESARAAAPDGAWLSAGKKEAS